MEYHDPNSYKFPSVDGAFAYHFHVTAAQGVWVTKKTASTGEVVMFAEKRGVGGKAFEQCDDTHIVEFYRHLKATGSYFDEKKVDQSLLALLKNHDLARSYAVEAAAHRGKNTSPTAPTNSSPLANRAAPNEHSAMASAGTSNNGHSGNPRVPATTIDQGAGTLGQSYKDYQETYHKKAKAEASNKQHESRKAVVDHLIAGGTFTFSKATSFEKVDLARGVKKMYGNKSDVIRKVAEEKVAIMKTGNLFAHETAKMSDEGRLAIVKHVQGGGSLVYSLAGFYEIDAGDQSKADANGVGAKKVVSGEGSGLSGGWEMI